MLVKLDSVGATSEGGWGERLRVLNDADIRPPGLEDGKSEGHRRLTWIWLTPSAAAHLQATVDGPYDESLRAEWAKSQARAERWEEEVVLIPIEMRRVLRNMVHRAQEWRI